MSDDLPITFSYGTDVGRVREHNEDSVAVYNPTDPTMKRKGRLFIVADGMGGYLAGEVASQMAADTVQCEYYGDPAEDPATCLQNAVQAANAAVYQSAHSDNSRSGMGTTIVATALVGRKAYIAAVGDSRAYVVHQGELSQITQDHSFVGEQIRAGLLTKEQARTHPQRNVITRALGSQPTVQVDTFEGELSDGDILIMCSDGLTGHVPENRLLDVVMQLPPEQAVKTLIQMANEGGGTDNISTIVLRVGASTLGAVPAKETQRVAERTVVRKPVKRGFSPIWLALGAAIVLIGVIVVGALALGMGGILVWEGKLKPTPTIAPTSPPPPPTVTTLPTAVAPIVPTVAPSAPSVPTSTLIPTPLPTPTPRPVLPTVEPTASPTQVTPTLLPTATEKPEKDKSGNGAAPTPNR